MRVAVIGAGIGGLSAAIALRREGIEATVFEQAPEPKALGAGLHLWNNAVRALQRIGLGGVTRIATTVERERIHTADGEVIAEWPVTELADELGVPAIGLNRPDFLRLLLDGLGGDGLCTGHRCTGFDQDAGGVTVRFGAREEERFDLLVGADGLHSTIRAELHGAKEPRYAGYTSWRTIVPPQESVPDGFLGQYWGRGARFVFFPAGADGRVYFVGLVRAAAGGRDPDGHAKETLLERFGDFCDPVPALIAAADEERLIRSDIVDRRPIRRWGRGRVTLLGDAAHPMTPNTSQGAGMALEDAVELARCVGRHGGSPESLREYERHRWKRNASMVTAARFPGTLGRWEHPLAVELRRRYMRVTFGGPVWRQLKKTVAYGF